MDCWMQVSEENDRIHAGFSGRNANLIFAGGKTGNGVGYKSKARWLQRTVKRQWLRQPRYSPLKSQNKKEVQSDIEHHGNSQKEQGNYRVSYGSQQVGIVIVEEGSG